MRNLLGTLAMMGSLFGASCSMAMVDWKTFPDPAEDLVVAEDAGPQTIVLAGGCFSCVESAFEQMPGVIDVVSGYAGGEESTANYEAVCTGKTGHAEAVQITYDPTKTSLGRMLKLFFAIAHDPTQLNRQGPDVGTQYRSAVFYANEDQRRVAAAYIAQLDAAGVFEKPIVTTIEPLERFYIAERYHQDFVRNNPNHPYVVQQALPKRDKAKKAAEAEAKSE